MRKVAFYITCRLLAACFAFVLSLASVAGPAWAESAAELLPKRVMLSNRPMENPVANAAFVPGHDPMQADPLHATISIEQTELMLDRDLAQPVCDGRPVKLGGSCRGGADKRLFPALSLEI
ncbi:MAG: hypothetical protein ACE5LB_17070, partial [Acidiferrobacterales bacterium]